MKVLIPFIIRQDSDTDYQSLDETMDYLPWSKKYEEYREAIYLPMLTT
jgi:hypothetical protein